MTTATTEKQPARFLGDGQVNKVFKRYMFVEDIRYGRVYIPLEAASPKHPNCTDLRNFFNINDNVVYTAIRQAQKQHECNYVACSVVHKNDLQIISGKIVEKCNQYAYVDSLKLGKIFVPFSAKSEGGRPWHGRNAELNSTIAMKVLPQPEFQKCCHVAFEVRPIVPTVKEEPLAIGSTRADRQPESITQQFGVIVSEPTDNCDGLIYAQTTGSISFAKSALHGKQADSGTFVFFDAIKSLSSQQHEKCSWKASSVNIIGSLPCVESDMAPNRFSPNLDNCLTVTATAIVCRVSHSNSSAWLWNDLLGRIFVNNHHYVEDLHAFDVVTVKAQYTAAFEDVPWSAISVRIVRENENALREEYGQLMVTSDNWKVLYVCEQTTGGFYGFMENPSKEAAFMAWTDLNVGETPPRKDALCRVTAYKQHRDKRHPWRALLVTPLDDVSLEPLHYHPVYPSSGSFAPTILSQIRQQQKPLRQLSQPHGATTNVWTVPSATITSSRIVSQQTSSSNTSIDSGRVSAGFSNVLEPTPLPTTVAPIEPPPGFGNSSVNLPIGAERALNLQSGDTPRTPPVDPFVIPAAAKVPSPPSNDLLNDSMNNIKIVDNQSNENKNNYFDPWNFGIGGLDRSNTWQPLGTTPLMDSRIINGISSNGGSTITNGFASPTRNAGYFMASSSPPLIHPPHPRQNIHQSLNSSNNDTFKKFNTATSLNDEIIKHESEIFDNFLVDEIIKRPHLVPELVKKLFENNTLAAQRMVKEIAKQQQYLSNRSPSSTILTKSIQLNGSSPTAI